MTVTSDRPVGRANMPATDGVLFINFSDSRCGSCKRNADPGEGAHTMATMKGEGCGATFTAVSTNYTGSRMEARVREMRPDLPFISPMAPA